VVLFKEGMGEPTKGVNAMKPEDKVVSPPLAVRMIKLGWDFDTDQYWCQGPKWQLVTPTPHFSQCMGSHIPAPDAIEIGERLPKWITKDTKTYDFWLIKHTDSSWIIAYTRFVEKKTLKSFNSKSLAEALGKMWCYLKERKLDGQNNVEH